MEFINGRGVAEEVRGGGEEDMRGPNWKITICAFPR
jgi:hypothetical protein